MKQRLDLTIVSRNLARSRTEAQDRISHGKVFVNGAIETKASKEVGEADVIRVTERIPYVGRGGLKLEHALNHFHIDLKNKIVLDVGSSTGGFTDCALAHGAQKVYAVDVGTFQMVEQLRFDPRVILMEQTDIRDAVLPEKVDCVVIDVSFISLTKITDAIVKHVKQGTLLIALVKPQFEVGQKNIGKQGVVTDDEKREEAVTQVLQAFIQSGVRIHDVTPSPILGGDGNKEFLLYGTYAF